jgi:hypothetical protein
MIEINEHDSNFIIMLKLCVVILTVVAVSFSAIKQGIDILKIRHKFKMGFGKEV